MTDKMKISAIICELNPFHFGHRAVFRHAKAHSDALVCVMSGNFVQRGEPAIIDKYTRTEIALQNGADLVIELPLPWACSGAEHFAQGAVHLISALGCVDFLAFGSEEADANKLMAIAKSLLSSQFSQMLSVCRAAGGETFAKTREAAVSALLGEEYAALLRKPNCILGIEYCKALLRENSNIEPLVLLRSGAGHDGIAENEEFRSAGELRELLRQGSNLDGLIPCGSFSAICKEISKGHCPTDISLLERSILCKLRALPSEDFSCLPNLSEGIENRLRAAVRTSSSLEDLYSLIKSKRYTHARIRRLVLHAFLGVTNDLPPLPPFLRVLGMTQRGANILKKSSSALPIAARYADFEKLGGQALRLFLLEATADDLFALSMQNPIPCGSDYTQKLIKLIC